MLLRLLIKEYLLALSCVQCTAPTTSALSTKKDQKLQDNGVKLHKTCYTSVTRIGRVEKSLFH